LFAVIVVLALAVLAGHRKLVAMSRAVEERGIARADTSCESCRAQDLVRATNPDHAAQGWTSDCQRCHMPVAGDGAAFSHGSWPLSGAHASASCSGCHVANVFAGTPQECGDCHQLDYDTATDPDRVTAMFIFPTTCSQCHSTGS